MNCHETSGLFVQRFAFAGKHFSARGDPRLCNYLTIPEAILQVSCYQKKF
ncbi:hypothetical protein NC652_025575 [Populus alba x Populus x berolinensis]|nr:hypothetical protein NC652_025575 [Populus alba x Populus x berolinensis]